MLYYRSHAVRLTPIIYLRISTQESRSKSKMFNSNKYHAQSLSKSFAITGVMMRLRPGSLMSRCCIWTFLLLPMSSWLLDSGDDGSPSAHLDQFLLQGGGRAADIRVRLIKLNTSHIWWMADAITVGHFTRGWAGAGEMRTFTFKLNPCVCVSGPHDADLQPGPGVILFIWIYTKFMSIKTVSQYS